MGQRTLKRVPLDFDWPLKEVWQGYLMPDDLRLPTCHECAGEGYGREARAIAYTFYPHMIGGPHADALAWCDKIGQAEVDHLAAEGRLRDFGDSPTAEQVNAAERGPRRGFWGHDAINRLILIRFRCEQLGIPPYCPACEGSGELGTPEQRAAYEAWEPSDPPKGDGYQLWETTSEGSPVSPVFPTAEALARWCADNATLFAGQGADYAAWMQLISQDAVDIGSTMMFAAPASR